MHVIKIGGGDVAAEGLFDELATLDGPWILVHGGHEAMDTLVRRTGAKPHFVTSPNGHVSRLTDAGTMQLLQMAYRGERNAEIVRALVRRGIPAVGLCGLDAKLIEAERKTAFRAVVDGKTVMIRDDLSGRPTAINTHLLTTLIGAGYRPVVTIPAYADGAAVNVDTDRVAARVAAAMGSDRLVILSDVEGLRRDADDPTSLVQTLDRTSLDDAAAWAKGRFKSKLLAVREALDGGVRQVHIATTSGQAPIAAAERGGGTVVR